MTALVLYHDTYACTGSAGATAPDLVLLHGWGMHSVVWDPIVPALLEHYQVTVIDLPGMGRSPLPGGHYDLDYVIQHLLAVAPARAVWMGWSLGGEIATAIAARYPERVSALLLVASNPSFARRDDWSCAMPSEQLQQFRDFYEEDPEGTLIRFLSLQCRGSRRMKEDIRFLQEILYLQGLPAPQALRAGLRLLAEVDVRELILEALPMFSREEMGDHALKLDAADRTFKGATREFKRCVWGGGTARKEKCTAQINWWYFRTPARSNAQLEDELATVR